MSARRYVLGVDFGTLSARAVLVDVESGEEVAWKEHAYPHGVIEGALPDQAVSLPPGVARQDPADYFDALRKSVRGVLDESGVRKENVIGVGVDFTSCTILPVRSDGQPLCFDARFRSNPDAWVHLWKDQTAQHEASVMTERARERGEGFLKEFGNKVSADSLYPKVWQIIKRSPEVFYAADRFVEAGDWIVWYLTGAWNLSASAAAFKAMWKGGFPEGYLAALDPNLVLLTREKMGARYLPPGARAGGLRQEVAEELGLAIGTPVAVANIDAHAALPGAGVAEPGTMVLVMGTSMCHMILGESVAHVPGICGAVVDGIIPGYVGYEAGQPALGDSFSWFANNFTPAAYHDQAKRLGLSPLEYLESLAQRLSPGECGLLALDWWNGNRSPLANGNLRGLIVGLSLQSRPEDVYRALLEAAAFGTLEIIRAFEENGVPVQRIRTCGGVAMRSRLMLQVLADITGRSIEVAGTSGASALGAAIYAALAAGSERGGYDSPQEAVARLSSPVKASYHPDPERHQVYNSLYGLYRELSEHYGKGRSKIMESLLHLRTRASER